MEKLYKSSLANTNSYFLKISSIPHMLSSLVLSENFNLQILRTNGLGGPLLEFANEEI